MRKVVVLSICLSVFSLASAQNLELRSNKDIKQPALVNPALAGLQENFFRLLTSANLSNYSLMVEGKIPFKLGNYNVGYQRLSNDYVSDNMFNFTYGKSYTRSNGLTLRVGGALEVHSRASLKTDSDSVLFRYTDLNGDVTEFHSIDQITGKINYFNLNLGASLTYKSLIVSATVENLVNPKVSLVDSLSRRLPLSGNLLVLK